MRCVVPSCDRESTSASCKNITFFTFPKELSHRATWLKALCKAGLQPQEDGVVCSDHFLTEDLLQNGSGLYELRADALPALDVQVCRICFAQDTKLYPMTAYKTLYEAYESLTGLLMGSMVKVPPYLCTDCANRVLNSARFKIRSLRAHDILLELAQHDCITLESIQSIKELQNRFRVDLTGNQAQNEFDLNIEMIANAHYLPGLHSIVDCIKMEIGGEICQNLVIEDDGVVESSGDRDETENDKEVEQAIGSGASTVDTVSLTDAREEVTGDHVKTENDEEFEHVIVVKEVASNAGTCVVTCSHEETVADSIETENNQVIEQDPDTEEDVNSCGTVVVSSSHEDRDSIKFEMDEQILEVLFIDEDASSDCGRVDTENNDVNQDSIDKDTNDDTERKTAFIGKEYSLEDSLISKGLGQVTTEPENVNHTKVGERRKLHLDCELLKTKLSCDVCHFETNSQNNLLTHLKAHTASKSHNCKRCSYKTIYSSSLKQHLLMHSGEKPFSCDICNKIFSRKCHLKRHTLTHSHEKLYTCDVCKVAFSSKSSLQMHSPSHSDAVYSCDICKKEFTRRYHLRKHVLTHTGVKPYSCDICKRSFRRKDDLQNHSLIHSGKRPYSCDVCYKSYSHKRNLQTHLRTHSTKKPYPCNVCKKAFNYSHNLQNHLRIHSGERPYCCDICKKTFSRKDALRSHLLIHSDAKVHACEICNEVFTVKRSLKRHMLVHSIKEKKSCDICRKEFRSSNCLKKHMLFHSIINPLFNGKDNETK